MRLEKTNRILKHWWDLLMFTKYPSTTSCAALMKKNNHIIKSSSAHQNCAELLLQLFFYFEHLNFNESHYFLVINDKSLAALRLQGFFSLVRGIGLEPMTPCTSSMCSTSWANRANRTVIYYYIRILLSTSFFKKCGFFLPPVKRLFIAYAKSPRM